MTHVARNTCSITAFGRWAAYRHNRGVLSAANFPNEDENFYTGLNDVRSRS